MQAFDLAQTDNPEPMTLPDAARFAISVLRDPTADQWLRQKAATELVFALDAIDECEKK